MAQKINVRQTLIPVVILLTLAVPAFAQKISRQYLPPQDGKTPEWFRVFYQDSLMQKVNVFRLDSLASAHEAYLKKQFKKTGTPGTNMSTGEEHQDIYLAYYKRWRRAMGSYVQDNGALKIPGQPVVYKPKAPRSARQTSAGGWSLLGPVSTHHTEQAYPGQPQAAWQVNIYACAMAKSNHDILYAAPETGGIFKTTDRGLNWSLALDDPEASGYSSIAVHPTDPETVYIGRPNTIKKSTDGGITWTTASPACGDVHRIVINPVNPQVVYAACDNGTYKSTDGGANWIQIYTGVSTDIALKPGNPSHVIMLNQPNGGVTGIVVSTDAGTSFRTVALSNEITADGGGRLAVTAHDPNRVYAVVLSYSTAKAVPYIFRSTDAGSTWTTTCTGTESLAGSSASPLGMSNGQGYYDLDIMADPLDADNVIVGTTTAYKSTDAAATFTPLGGYFGPFNIHPDIQCMIVDGSDTWIATDGGMNYATDFFTATANHSVRNKGIFGPAFWGFAQAWNEDMTGGGRYHNGNTALHENYPAGQALRLGGGESPTGYYLLGKERHMVFSDIGGKIMPDVFSGRVGDFSFGKYPNEMYFPGVSSEIEFFPYCYNHIFTGNGKELWKSTDGGTSWTSLHDFGSPVRQFEISKNNPAIIYLCTDNNLYKSVDTGKTWSVLTLPPGQSQNGKAITLSHTDPNTMWITAANNSNGRRIFKTTDGGASWVNMTTSTIDGLGYQNIVHQGGTNGGVYILGGGGTVYYRNNSMTDWADFSQSLPNGYHPMLTIPFYRDGKLRTAGNRGIWQTDFYEEGVPVAQPTVDKLSGACARDTFYFDDFSDLKKDGSTTWKWTFSGSPVYISSTTVRNPRVVFGAIGSYSFSLTVTNSMGSSSKSYDGIIQIINTCSPDTFPGKVLTTAGSGYGVQSKALGITVNTLTLSCWIKPNGIQKDYTGIVFSGSAGGSGLDFNGNNRLGYCWRNDAGTYNWFGGPIVPVNQWSHVALVITPVSATVYLNGIGYTRNATHYAVTFDQPFMLAADRGDVNRIFNGQMDEVCIYNRAFSQNEVRELMHLTRNNPNAGSLPGYDASLVAYYQFNESPSEPCVDKVGFSHVGLAGDAVKTELSAAPVGGGVFQRMNVAAGGAFSFSLPGVEINFPAAGTTPNGDLVVTRLNVPADESTGSIALPNNPLSYYIIRNFGTNQTFTSPDYIKFSKVQGITNAMVNNPAALQLYKRSSNAFGPTWGMPIDNAEVVANNNGTGTVEFAAGLNMTSFSQFSIGANGSALPLTLLSFTAGLQQDKTVLLEWHTANETNFSSFEIERSVNGINFVKFAFKQGAGGGRYSSKDVNPLTGISYYRLKMIDADGRFTYSSIRQIWIKPGSRLFTIYPNPTSGWIEMRIADIPAKQASVAIHNQLGQLLRLIYLNDIRSSGNIKFNVNVPAGIYTARITLDNGYSENHTVVVTD